MSRKDVTGRVRDARDLLHEYRRGPAILREAVAGMNAESLRARPIEGKWSTLEVLCHIVDSDQFMCDRMKRTIGTDGPILMGVESADYRLRLHYHERDPELDLRLLEVQREQMAADLDRLSAGEWERVATHSEYGQQTLLEMLDHAVDHLESHLDAIAEKRRALE